MSDDITASKPGKQAAEAQVEKMTGAELEAYALKHFNDAFGFGRKSIVELYHAGHAFMLIRDRLKPVNGWVAWQMRYNLPRPTVNQAIRVFENAKKLGGVKAIEKLGRQEAKALLGIVRPKTLLERETPPKKRGKGKGAGGLGPGGVAVTGVKELDRGQPSGKPAPPPTPPTTPTPALWTPRSIGQGEQVGQATIWTPGSGQPPLMQTSPPAGLPQRPIEQLGVVVQGLTEEVEKLDWRREPVKGYLERIEAAIEVLIKLRQVIQGQALGNPMIRGEVAR